MKIKSCTSDECTLCMACSNVCPHKAIYTDTDENGYELLLIDEEKCTDCGLCLEVCSRRNNISRNSPIKGFAAQANDKKRLKDSASGGAFQILALNVLRAGGVCYGAESVHDSNGFHVRHVRIDNENELIRILNSKYIPSIIGYSFKQAKDDLNSGKKVLFSGTPCQIQGLKAYLNKDYDNLLTVDLICHGVPSTQMFNDYIAETEKRGNITIVNYNFKDKQISWGTNYCYSYFKNRDLTKKIRTKHCPREASSFSAYYLNGNITRENCFSCTLSNMERVGDYTLGDFWKIETEYPEFVTKKTPRIVLRRGVSCVMANTTKALKHVEKIQSDMIIREVDLKSIEAGNGNLKEPSKRGKDRDKLLDLYRKNGYEAIEKQYRATVGKKIYVYNIKNAIKRHLPDRIRILIYNTPFLHRIVFH